MLLDQQIYDLKYVSGGDFYSCYLIATAFGGFTFGGISGYFFGLYSALSKLQQHKVINDYKFNKKGAKIFQLDGVIIDV